MCAYQGPLVKEDGPDRESILKVLLLRAAKTTAVRPARSGVLRSMVEGGQSPDSQLGFWGFWGMLS